MTTGANIPDDVRRFVLTSIPSVPYLEAMLLLRYEMGVGWDCVSLAQRLYLTEKAADILLTELQEAGVLSPVAHHSVPSSETRTSYVYAPSSDELRQMIDRLAEIYYQHLVEVTNLIHSKTSKKAQQFADAFKWRKEP